MCHNFFVGLVWLVVFCFLVWFYCLFWLHKLSQAAGFWFYRVFCFFSVCRRRKPYVDDIILGAERVGGFLVLVCFCCVFWLSFVSTLPLWADSVAYVFKCLHATTVAVKRMRVLAVVPVKGLKEPKKRLSNVLSPEERSALSAAMLRDVLDALKPSAVRDVLVVSPDSAVKEIADEYRFTFLAPKDADLNGSLKEAVEYALRENFDAVLILPADVPLVSPEGVSKLVELGSEPSTVVLSGSMEGGTNALLLHPADVIPVCFGKDSFYKHVEEALKRDAKLRFYFSREIMLDIDDENDLGKLREMNGDESKQVFKLLKTLKESEN